MANHKKIASALFNKSNSVFLIASLLCSTAINYSAIAQADLFYNKDLTSTAITSLMSATIDNDIDGVTFFVKSESSTISKKILAVLLLFIWLVVIKILKLQKF